MFARRPPRYRPSEITPKSFYDNRRRLLGALAAVPAISAFSARAESDTTALPATVVPEYSQEARGYESITPVNKAQKHNNFYELGTGKKDPYLNSHLYKPHPWKLEVVGEVNKPQTFDIDDLAKLAVQEERIFRLRCVEAWSMVIPWIGFSMSALINKVEPTADCKYVQFLTFNPEELFPSDSNNSLPWPYSEGLRLDEAMHPLTTMVFGMYGETLPTQNGAPMRIMIPWKYGFKSGKSSVRIVFSKTRPITTWNILQEAEYGFYANVNPQVSHPRWSQASERSIGDSLFPQRRDTDMFNGFGDEVASLYDGMDLTANF
ncbi:MAG: protein-methionine-sulfoxide reductase catalytic subunit MsrP [Gammaproteobacteria bacterium WSBS_2016_MAG_OTU1]